ncbi:MAG: hypothetical protein AB1429_07970 [Pseudomonadota bacterium]|jgi:hypothetical protein
MQRSVPTFGLTRLALVLALVAWSLRLAIPAGFMTAPAAAPGLAPLLVICDGAADAAKAKAASHAPAGDPAKADHACPFAQAATVAPPPPPVLFAIVRLASQTADIALAKPRDLFPGRGLAAPPPPSQGPPLSIV